MSVPNKLPYVDTKPQGAADFYYAVNATFKFIERRLGKEGLIRYWQDLGEKYMEPVWKQWQREGSQGIAAYWKQFFQAEPGAEVEVELCGKQEVLLKVKRCPAISHLRAGNREVLSEYCQHCYYISEAAAQRADYTVRVRGGNGSCEQRFVARDLAKEPQNMEEIKSC